MTMGWFSDLLMASATVRATTSEPPPAAYPTTHSMGRLFCANAIPGTAAARSPACSTLRRESCMRFILSPLVDRNQQALAVCSAKRLAQNVERANVVCEQQHK